MTDYVSENTTTLPLHYVVDYGELSKRTCRANKNQHEDDNYEPCGLHLRALRDGTYKCKVHGIMLA